MSYRTELRYKNTRGICSHVIPLLLLICFSTTPLAYADDKKTYINRKYNFKFEYSTSYDLKAISEWDFDLLKNGEIMLRGSVEDDVFKIFVRESEDKGNVFGRFARERSKIVCGADGPDGSTYCRTVKSERKYVSANGLNVMEFYLNFTREDYSRRTKHESTVGPVYMVDISRANRHLALMIFPGYGKLASLSTNRLAQEIIGSIELLP